MKTQDIRKKFLQYFKDNGHSEIASSPVIPHDDPTLLFINAGMNQFKDVFLGESKRDYTRAATSQKCIRVGGKHNDLENVGHTSRHLTFFEMLGNFSFGDYFKKEAIKFAWEVSTQVFGFDPDKIWPTVYKDDDEAFELWQSYVPAEKITRFGEKDNFWSMGDTGPCGPCTELFYDRGPKYSKATCPAEDPEGHRFLEFWNLVFMQYNRTDSGELKPLPKPSVDTGAGIERVMSLIMDVDSVFETDVLLGIIKEIEKISGVKYDLNDEEHYPAFRVIADHLRALSFAIADGVQPSNVDRGYVLRKVLRRAVRYGRSLGIDKPFLASLLPKLIELMGEDYQEIVKAKSRIEEILTTEEEAFLRTLRRGGNILNQIIAHAKEHGKMITGDEAFKLKDTYGLPLEEILLIAIDADLTVDTKRYDELEKEARERSRKAHKATKQVASENLFADYTSKHGACSFTGYTESESQSKITAIVVDGSFVESITEGQEGMIVLDSTPFYAEMGGQVGDTGTLSSDTHTFTVTDCQSPFKGVTAHIGKLSSGKLKVGDTITAAIDTVRRKKIANNHTATHLLHWALQIVLGEHIQQAGSVVDENRLRFDFSHHKALTDAEIRAIEDLVNEKIRGNLSVGAYELKYDEVQKRDDIKQFFGDKYGAKVRVIDIDYSKELCGGTHTSALGNIGLFRIAKEGSIAAGIRRIDAVTGADAETLQRESDDLINTMASLLKTQPQKLMGRIEKLLDENKALTQNIKEAKEKEAEGKISGLLDKIKTINTTPVLSVKVDVSAKDLRPFADALMQKLGNGVLVIAAEAGSDKCNLIVKVSDDCVKKGIKAVDIIRAIAPIVGGSGGGKADMAQAGGKTPEKIDEALVKAEELLNQY
ncbi:MAG: alanine--tRNA ligase [Chlamydiota bacterium]|nr:alanine--tRNA ligase [Chlamydiota bacterium]